MFFWYFLFWYFLFWYFVHRLQSRGSMYVEISQAASRVESFRLYSKVEFPVYSLGQWNDCTVDVTGPF